VFTDIHWSSQSCITWRQITPSPHFFDIHLDYSALYFHLRTIPTRSFF